MTKSGKTPARTRTTKKNKDRKRKGAAAAARARRRKPARGRAAQRAAGVSATRTVAPQILMSCYMTAEGPSWPDAPGELVELVQNDGRFSDYLARGGIVVTMTEPETAE